MARDSTTGEASFRYQHTFGVFRLGITGWKDGVWTWDAGGFRILITRGDNLFNFCSS